MKKSTRYFTLGMLWLLASGSVICVSQPRAGSDTSVTPKGTVAGPDIIVGDIGEFGHLMQLGSSAGQVGLAMGTTSVALVASTMRVTPISGSASEVLVAGS